MNVMSNVTIGTESSVFRTFVIIAFVARLSSMLIGRTLMVPFTRNGRRKPFLSRTMVTMLLSTTRVVIGFRAMSVSSMVMNLVVMVLMTGTNEVKKASVNRVVMSGMPRKKVNVVIFVVLMVVMIIVECTHVIRDV